MTYGGRGKNIFGGPDGSGLENKKYYLIIENAGTKKGQITIKEQTAISVSTDRTVGIIPLDNPFRPSSLLSTPESQYFSSAAGQKAIKNQGVITAQKAGAPDAQQLIFPNTALPTKSGDPLLNPTTAPVLTPEQQADLTSSTTFSDTSSSFKSEGMPLLSKNETYRYPLNLGDNTSKQDYIKFDIIEYVGRSINNPTKSNEIKIDVNGFFGKRNFTEEKPKSSIILPIQSGIGDENSVQWGGEDLDAVSAYFAGKSFNAIDKGLGKTLEEVFKDVGNIIAAGPNSGYATAMKTYLAGQAVGTNNLLSRTSGAIINPNLELLFQGPTLRPFNFNFRLSPREEKEAEQVKKIIRVFKEASAVRNTQSELFLKAPHVFKIRYIDGSSNDSHKSINLIKECALLSFSVNYTPENTYMTFNDSEHTMVSYELNMRFSELEPVTSQDYINKSSHSIGY